MSVMMMIGRAGVQSYQNQVNVVSNNIANINTNGFKKNDVVFKDLIHVEQDLPLMNGAEQPETFNQGFGVRSDYVYENFNQGALITTGNLNNMAISGEGFFAVRDAQTQQVYLTRDGSFSLDREGVLVDSLGNRVVTQVIENEDGTTSEMPLLYRPNQTANMTKVSQNYYAVDPDNLVSELDNPEWFGKIESGVLEGSNVDLATEMTNLMVANRAYSMNLKSIQKADETMELINQLKR